MRLLDEKYVPFVPTAAVAIARSSVTRHNSPLGTTCLPSGLAYEGLSVY